MPDSGISAEIIAVGSEMLTSQRVDTNSLYLTGELNNLGVEVTTKYVVGDDRARLAETVRTAISRTPIVILSGGLGPTEDDLTRDAAADAAGVALLFQPEIAAGIEARFIQMNRKMPETNKRQAFALEGAELLSNDRGTAPGQWLQTATCSLILLPGPPHELKSMFARECLPRLQARIPRQVLRTHTFRITGMSESELDQTISPVYQRFSDLATTVLAHAGDLQVQLRARCSTDAEADALLAEVTAPIRALLGDRIYSEDGSSLEQWIAAHIGSETVTVAESMTGGGLAERITSVPGSSKWFLGGFVTYTRQTKMALLGIPETTLTRFGTVSRETAEAMALGAREKTGASYAVSITGNAGPDADGDQAPVGKVFIGVADHRGTAVFERQFLGDRPRIRAFAAQLALDILRRRLDLKAV